MQPLTPDNSRLIEEATNAIDQYGLRPFARLLLEAGKPLALIGGQLLWIAQPALSLLLPAQKIGQWAHFLESPDALLALQHQIEQTP